MNFAISFYLLTGIMLGFELVTTEEGERCLVLDLLILRIMFEY
jgi:hypothetical protein